MDSKELDRHIDEIRELAWKRGMGNAARICELLTEDLHGEDIHAALIIKTLHLAAQTIRDASQKFSATDGAPCPS